jgi:uncharacterized protein YndB with AHSA1/START domain
MIDVTHQINAVRRHVGARALEAGEARVLAIGRTYDAPIDDVWDAVTNPERLPRWFLPVSGDLREHGRYQLEGNASGTIERCDPPKSFAATWEYGGEVSWIEVRLSSVQEGGTRLELEHTAHIDDERWLQFGPGAMGVGWDLGLMGLDLYLSSGRAVEPVWSTTWDASDEARQFKTLSSQRWRDAGVAAGDDPTRAQAAADRTTAFYTETDPEASPES